MWVGTGAGMDYEFFGDFISENNGSKNTGELKLQVCFPPFFKRYILGRVW
jgi:hypothetical protein